MRRTAKCLAFSFFSSLHQPVTCSNCVRSCPLSVCRSTISVLRRFSVSSKAVASLFFSSWSVFLDPFSSVIRSSLAWGQRLSLGTADYGLRACLLTLGSSCLSSFLALDSVLNQKGLEEWQGNNQSWLSRRLSLLGFLRGRCLDLKIYELVCVSWLLRSSAWACSRSLICISRFVVFLFSWFSSFWRFVIPWQDSR